MLFLEIVYSDISDFNRPLRPHQLRWLFKQHLLNEFVQLFKIKAIICLYMATIRKVTEQIHRTHNAILDYLNAEFRCTLFKTVLPSEYATENSEYQIRTRNEFDIATINYHSSILNLIISLYEAVITLLQTSEMTRSDANNRIIEIVESYIDSECSHGSIGDHRTIPELRKIVHRVTRII